MADAADKIIEVPGMGNVSFPGTMTDDDISSVIRSNVATQNLQKQVANYPQSFQQSPEAAQARGDRPDLSQAGLTERLWKPITTGLVSRETLTPGAFLREPSEMQKDIEKTRLNESPLHAAIRVGAEGAALDTGKVLSSLTSPASLGTAVLGSVGEIPGAIGTAAKATLLGLSPVMATQGGIESAEGLEKGVSTPEGAEEFLSGAGQMTGGLAGMREGGKLLPEASEAIRETAVQNPNAIKATGRIGGGLLGSVGGELVAPHSYGGGSIGGLYVGQKIGADLGTNLVKYAEDRAISQVIDGSRPFESLPVRLLPQLRSRMAAQESAYADIMARTGQTVDELKIPQSLKQGVQQMYEERSRQTPASPLLVKTPEQVASEANRAAAFSAAKEEMRPEASLRGMAHAAGRHEQEWVPSKRGITKSSEKTFRIVPSIKK